MNGGATTASTERTPALRFLEFEGEWLKSRLDELATRRSGHTPDKQFPEYWDGGIKWVSLADSKKLDAGYIRTTDKEISQQGIQNSSAVLLPEGTVILSRDAGVGKSAILASEMAVSQHFIAWICDDYSQLNNWFLYHWLQIKKEYFERQAVGSTILTIGLPLFKKLKIDHPSLPEQKKIAAFLGVVDAKIAALRARRDGLERYKRGLMQALFSQSLRFTKPDGTAFPDWEEKRLGDVSKIYDGTHQTPNYVADGVPFFSVEHVTANNFSKTKFISEDVFAKESSRVILKRGDILMTRIGDIGTCRLIDWDVRASFYVSLALVKCDSVVNSNFLNQFMKSVLFQRELWKRTIHVAFPKKINLGEIGNCLVLLPHPDEQAKIADALSAMDAKIAAVKDQVTKMEAFKKGLLQQMFV